MTVRSSFFICLAVVSVTIPLRAANRPHTGMDRQAKVVWTNDDLEKLHDLGLISIIGQPDEETPAPETAPEPYVMTEDSQWYVEQADKIDTELERRETQLREYRQALEDVRSLKNMTGGIDLSEGDFALTPEAGIEILQRRVRREQARLDALEDLARRNDIPPGVLRGQ